MILTRWRSSRYCPGAKRWGDIKAALQQIKKRMSKTAYKLKKKIEFSKDRQQIMNS